MTEEELTPFFASLHASITTMASKILGQSEADDIVADCFLTVLIRKKELPPDKADWERWIIGIAKNKVRHEYQRRSRKHHDYRFVHDWTAPGDGPTTEDASRSVIETNLARIFHAQLSHNDKQLFELAFIQDMPAPTAAASIGISLTAYTSRLCRLRHKLRAHFDESEPPEAA